MAIRVQHHANVSKQATLLNRLDDSPLKWRVCGCGLNRSVHEDMNHISNVKVHLKTRSGNVNIQKYTRACVLSGICYTINIAKPVVGTSENKARKRSISLAHFFSKHKCDPRF